MDPRTDSIWLSDWRTFADEATGLSRQQLAMVDDAVRHQEQMWQQRHVDAYRGKLREARARRDQDVVAPYDAMIERLKEMRNRVATGHMTTNKVRAEMARMQEREPQLVALHDALVEQDEELARFAAMTPDEYQREQLRRFASVRDREPTLAGLVAERNPVRRTTYDPNYVPSDDGADPDEVDSSRDRDTILPH